MTTTIEIINKQYEKLFFDWLLNVEDDFKNGTYELINGYKKEDGVRRKLIIDFYKQNKEEYIYTDLLKIKEYYEEYDILEYEPELTLCSIEFKGENEHKKVIGEEILRFIRYYIKTINLNNNNCDDCHLPFGFESELINIETTKGITITNNCKVCEEKNLKSLYYSTNDKLKNGELCCDICQENFIKKNGEDKIILMKPNELICCKGKYMCNKCFFKQDEKCFFCRQHPIRQDGLL